MVPRRESACRAPQRHPVPDLRHAGTGGRPAVSHCRPGRLNRRGPHVPPEEQPGGRLQREPAHREARR
ncbi:hypothetical protein G6F24_017514 [Rhizopus arrhizus]|nr:hypothetical protein G6F24_017514 [Rhizopus arrhizus]